MTDTPSNELPAVYARDLETQLQGHRWLIHQLWSRNAVGLLAGPPKVAKTFCALDFAVSVASGTPALGRFPVEASGPALVYLAEDAREHVRDRLEGLCRHRHLDINRLTWSLSPLPCSASTPGRIKTGSARPSTGSNPASCFLIR